MDAQSQMAIQLKKGRGRMLTCAGKLKQAFVFINQYQAILSYFSCCIFPPLMPNRFGGGGVGGAMHTLHKNHVLSH